MNNLQNLKSELQDALELYDWVVVRIKELTNQIDHFRVEREDVQ